MIETEFNTTANKGAATPTCIDSAEIESLVNTFKNKVDPLARMTCNVANTTPAERIDIFRSALIFCEKGPNVEAPNFPIPFNNQYAFHGDPDNNTANYRFSGAQQVANWVADTQARQYTTAGPLVRYQIQLTSDNGRHWSAPVDIFCV